jgi:hypothetical protein
MFLVARFASFTLWTEMHMNTNTCVSFLILIAINAAIISGVPAIYNQCVHKKRSIITEDVLSQFEIAEEQPFTKTKLALQAQEELEMETLLLFESLRSLRVLRSKSHENDPSNFEKCLLLATFIHDKYIQKEYSTLVWYDLENIVGGIKTPLELIERADVRDLLAKQVRERCILPMFARMIATSKTRAMHVH